MPSAASSVGPLALPLAPGQPGSAVDDPTLTGFGAYLAYWLNSDLNAKLASLQPARTVDGSLITAAVPSGNVFPWNPTKPNAFFTRGQGDGAPYPLPALYIWDDADKRAPFSQLHGMRERAVRVAWIFEDALLPDWLVDRHGLRAAACATLFRAVEQGWHPGYNSRQTIAVQLALAGRGIVYQGSERAMLSPVVDAPQGSDQPAVRAFPAAVASYLVYERENGPTATAAEQAPDLLVRTAMHQDGDVAKALNIATKVAPAPPYLEDT